MKILLLVFALLLSNFIYGQTAVAPLLSDGSYQIANVGNLYWISIHSEHWNKHYKQTANIDLTAASINTWNSSTGWSPIGNFTIKFTGSYNGQGYVINGLYISRTDDYQGLFGYTIGSTIQNVALTNVSVSGRDLIGGLVGNNCSSTISNSYSIGTVSGHLMVGGLVGYNYSATINNSYSSGTVSGISGSISTGGLVGDNSLSTIVNSYSSGTVSGTDITGGSEVRRSVGKDWIC